MRQTGRTDKSGKVEKMENFRLERQVPCTSFPCKRKVVLIYNDNFFYSATFELKSTMFDIYFSCLSDSFVKVDIMYVGKKLHSRTTKVVNKNRNPDYEDETFHFIIPDDKMPQTTVVFKVKHRGKMSDKPVGIVKLGYDADREMEYRHLEQVLDKPHLSIANWHVIRKYR